MKFKMQFGEETRFDKPVRRMIRTRAPWLPSLRLSLRALALAEQTKPSKGRID
jgi:hypothetical protein